jgi:hypothetical protein
MCQVRSGIEDLQRAWYERLSDVVVIVDGGLHWLKRDVERRRREVCGGAMVERHTGKMDDRSVDASVGHSTVSMVGGQFVDGRRAWCLEPVFAQPVVQLHSRDPQSS